jgi:hypothetical protein
MTPIGKISATLQTPSSSDEFTFWLGKEEVVAPFDMVAANNANKSTTVGVIKDIQHITDSQNHIANYVSHDFGDVELEPMTERLGTVFVSTEVMNNDKEIYMPLQDGQKVRFASEDEIRQALGIDSIPKERQIPTGYLQQSNGTIIPVSLDSGFLIGPEGAHLNVSGISGLATKTSFIMFLLQSIMQTESSKKTAIILFNVKGDDLLYIDKLDKNSSDKNRDDWKKCGLEAKPFENVKYFFPFINNPEKGYANSWCTRNDIEQLFADGRCGNYIYTFKNDKEKIDLLLSNIDDPNFTLDSIQSEILSESFENVTDWRDLMKVLEQRGQSGQGASKIPVVSWRRFHRLLSTIFKSETSGIFRDCLSDQQSKKQIHLSDEICKIRGGDTIVVDIAQIPEQQKCLVFGDVIRTVYKMKTDVGECPERIIIFVDELNKYAPSNVKGSPIINNLIEIAERGRSLGIVLFSAEQFRSAIHDRVIGNCATNVYGRTNSVEIATTGYRHLPKTFTAMMTRLPKGSLIIQHPIFRTLIKITFPRPAYFQPEH